MTAAEPQLRGHMPALDGVRAVAVLLVVLHHVFLGMKIEHPVDVWFEGIARSGWVGVDLFFVLSGFLITGILLDARDGPYFKPFYWRRLVRIFPLYYAYLLVVFVVVPLFLGKPLWPRASAVQGWFWAYLGNVPLADDWIVRGINHFWSLAIEEQFYLVWPAVVWVLGRRWLLPFTVATVVGVAVLRGVLAANGVSDQFIYVSTVTRFDALAWGALVAILARTGGLLRWRSLAQAVLLVAGPAMAVFAWQHHGIHVRGLPPLGVALSYSGLGAVFAAGITLVLTSDGVLTQALSSPLRTIGKYTYAMYVFQVGVDVWLRIWRVHPRFWIPKDALHLPAMLGYWLLVSAVTLGLSWVSWNLMEKHFLKLKDRYRYR